jgi:hypothetical protein
LDRRFDGVELGGLVAASFEVPGERVGAGVLPAHESCAEVPRIASWRQSRPPAEPQADMARRVAPGRAA